ncbi:MAG: hypothetical protein IPN58_19380 [Anaerolineales bacterium]|nr:hypothetical protein [Anaerolineales bacterium]
MAGFYSIHYRVPGTSLSTIYQFPISFPATLIRTITWSFVNYNPAEAVGFFLCDDILWKSQWARSLHERVAKGWTVEGLRVDKFKNNIARLTCATNDSRFREGDLVVLHRGNPHDENAQHCELQYDGENELEVSLIRGNEYFFAEQPDGWIMDQDWFDSSPFYLGALDTVADSQRGRSIILPLLQGSLLPKIDYAKYERAKEDLRMPV